MFDIYKKQLVRAPKVKPVKVNKKMKRVRLNLGGKKYDLRVEEALDFANKLVDAAEEFSDEA